MLELTFTQDKETKGKLRYALHEGPIVGSLYLAKADADKLAKDGKLVVVVKAAKD